MAAKSTPPVATDLERRIDELYQIPLTEFTAARNALAKGLPRADATRVKQLAKPTLLPWTVNQVYWSARSIHDRLMETGAALRAAQVAAIEKPGATDARARQTRDRVHQATEAHRRAVADAVHQALRLSGKAGVHPPADALTRMLEAISLAAAPAGPPGRLSEVVQPAGFEALFGVTPSSRPIPPHEPPPAAAATAHGAERTGKREERRETKEEIARRKEAAQRAKEEVRKAAQALSDAREAEQAARRNADRAERDVREAERALERLRVSDEAARTAATEAAHAREAAERALAAARKDDRVAATGSPPKHAVF